MKKLVLLVLLIVVAIVGYAVANNSITEKSPTSDPRASWNMYQDFQDSSDFERNPWKYRRD